MKKSKKSKRVNGKIRNAIKKKSKENKKKLKKIERKNKALGKNKLTKQLDIPNLCPWKEELLTKHLSRLKEIGGEKNNHILKKKQRLNQNRKEMLSKAMKKSFFGERMVRTEKKTISKDNLNLINQRWSQKELKSLINQSDVLIEVLDARDPLSCRCRSIEKRILNQISEVTNKPKRLILLINKIDLIPSEILSRWIKIFCKEFPVIAFKCNTQNQKKTLGQDNQNMELKPVFTSQSVGTDALLGLLKNYSRSLNLKFSISIGFIGYPNTGKSSVINSIKRSRAVGTSSRPGFTTSLQKIRLDSKIKLIDCPGVLMNEKENINNLVLRNVIKIDSINSINAVIDIVSRCHSELLMKMYQIIHFNNATEFLYLIAKSRGKLKKGGVPDIDQAARIILKDWNSGRIPFYVSPPGNIKNEKEIVVTSNWSKELNINAMLQSNHDQSIKILHEQQQRCSIKFVELQKVIEK